VPARIPHAHGRTYLNALARPVPRALWPDKPKAADTLLTARIWPRLAAIGGGFAFSLFGEPYLNFGLAGVAAFARTSVTVGEGDEGRSEQALLVSGEYFRVLGVRPARGRLLTGSDDPEGAPLPVAVVSWDYWQDALSGDAAVLGKSITVNGRRVQVVGVAPRRFAGTEPGSAPALWMPLGMAPALGYDAQLTRSRAAAWLSLVARLAPGVTVEQARAATGAPLRTDD
jgi:hypothetical protein